MPQIKQPRDLQTRYPKNPGNGRVLNNSNVVHATLDARGERLKVVVRLNDGVEVDFPVPTSKEIRDRFFYKKAKSSDKPARPPNKFFIFRTMFQGAVDAFKLQVPIVSGIASEVWKKSSPEVREVFTRLSQIAKTEHGEINPGYVYKPHRKQLKDVSSADNDVDSTRERPDGESTTSSPCLSSSTPSSPCTPTMPLWSASSENALSACSAKNNESYISSNLSLQSISSNFHSSSPHNDSYPAALYPQHQLTINLSYGDPTYIHHHHHHQINAMHFITQPDSYQYYQYPIAPYPLVNSTNDETPVNQQSYSSYRSQKLISYGSNNEGDSHHPITYYPSVGQDSPPHFATNFTDMINEAALISTSEGGDDKTLLQDSTQTCSPSVVIGGYDRNHSQRILSSKHSQCVPYSHDITFPEYYRSNQVVIKRLKEDYD